VPSARLCHNTCRACSPGSRPLPGSWWCHRMCQQGMALGGLNPAGSSCPSYSWPASLLEHLSQACSGVTVLQCDPTNQHIAVLECYDQTQTESSAFLMKCFYRSRVVKFYCLKFYLNFVYIVLITELFYTLKYQESKSNGFWTYGHRGYILAQRFKTCIQTNIIWYDRQGRKKIININKIWHAKRSKRYSCFKQKMTNVWYNLTTVKTVP